MATTTTRPASGRLVLNQKSNDKKEGGVSGSVRGIKMVGLAKDLLGDLRGGHGEVGVKGVHDTLLSLPKCSLLGHAHKHEDV
jgi:hypothetical protein